MDKIKSKTGKKKFIIAGLILLVVAGAGYGVYYFTRRKDESADYIDPTSASAGKKTVSGFGCKSTSYPLRYGTCHADVGILQRYLKTTYKAGLGNYGKNKDGIDNQLGNVTKNAALKHLGKEVFTEKDIAGMKAALKIITT